MVVLLSLIGLPAASAETWSAPDKRRDVTSLRYSPDPEPCGTTVRKKKPRDKKTDIVGLSVDHGPEVVVVEISLRSLRPKQKFGAQIDVRTSGRDYEVEVDRYAPQGFPDVYVTEEYVPDDPEPGACGPVGIIEQPLECDDLVTSSDATTDVVRVEVPRSCLGQPDWVRVGVATYRFKGMTSFHDFWGRRADSPKDNPWVNPLGPRVHADAA